ncbi:AGC/AKT protein kinase [Phytophthora cinnamomi]|uniref:AGC/AKT protein kinase n=1 Tax=Phytophthora cinnamomi TaxID=4785 RepID=UPI0035596A51|nr:AGC/AKT protein kinase [Phytophthora cinnamomi]
MRRLSSRAGGKNFSLKSEEDVEELMQTLVAQIHAKLKSELNLREIFIPNSKAEARCNIFVSHNYAACPKLCVFLQPGEGMQPGMWSRTIHPKTGFQGSMIPYLKTAIQGGYGVVILNPSTNFCMVNGHRAKILHSSSPEAHVSYVWKNYIVPNAAQEISFIVHDNAGVLLKTFLSTLSGHEEQRVGGIAFIESAHQISSSDSNALRDLLREKAVNFEASTEPMFTVIGSSKARLGCMSLSVGRTSGEANNREWTVHSVQTSAFVFLQSIASGIEESLHAIRATFPNKLIVTVNRARLTGQPYNNPFAVVQCAGQKKETVGSHKHTMDPEWNQTFSFPVTSSEAKVVIIVKDRSFPMNTTLGQVVVSMSEVGLNRADRRWFSLRDEKVPSALGNGELELTLEWVHDTFVARSDSFIRGNRMPTLEAQQQRTRQGGDGENSCYLCKTTFVLHRRRYCRMCLRLVCTSCSDRLFLPGFSEPKRVCSGCCDLQMMLHNKLPRMGPNGPGSKLPSQDKLDEHAQRMEAMRKREEAEKRPLSINDFDLLKVVGRGAFGKVLLVRKKDGKNAGQIYAMKILVKSHIIKNDQIENTKAEQHILKEISHPYVVRLRYAFQNADKLYLIMDYYPGGSMFYHLRKSKRFTEDRTRLYMAQLLTALMHLHSKQIAYRDLKLENILMDPKGNIALTDFAEYMAPELLRHQPYGKVVDWWSYGILLFEMLTGRTPFVDRNRRQMFKNIMQSEVIYPSHISPVARSLISKLLNRDPARRLGGGPNGGRDIMAHPFFESIDWDKLMRKEIEPPFVPDVSSVDDITNVPEMFQNMAAVDSPVNKKNGEGHHFDDFTYQEDGYIMRATHNINQH